MFECDFPGCNSRYRRKEHLKRHRIRHEEHVPAVSCPHCDRKLTRKERSLASTSPFLPPAVPAPRVSVPQGMPDLSSTKEPLRRTFTVHGLSAASSNPENPTELQTEESYVQTYFDYFHPEWPFLHRPSFDPKTEPGVLVQSVVMVGMWVHGSRNSQDAAKALHRKLGSAIQSQRNQWDHSNLDPPLRSRIPWPVTTYQSVLLHIILSILMTRESGAVDLGLRHRIPADEYDLLTALVRSCRRLGVFSYTDMLAQYDSDSPLTMIWVGVEEMKRFSLALYKVAHICTAMGLTETNREKLLTIAELSFCVPDSDELWSHPGEGDPRVLPKAAAQTNRTENGDFKEWISKSSTTLHDPRVNFEWI